MNPSASFEWASLPHSPVDGAKWGERFPRSPARTGYIQGENLVIEARWAGNRYDELPALVDDVIARKVDILLVAATPAALAAMKATKSIPIVGFGLADPLRSGLATNLARPDKNLTASPWDGAAHSGQIDHRFHGDCDQSFRGKAISGSTSNRSGDPGARRAGGWTLLGGIGVSQVFVLSHGFSAQSELVGVMHQPIEDGVGEGGIADRGVPLLDGDLAGDDGGAALISIVDDLEQIAAVGVGHRRHGQIVKDEDLGLGQGLHELGIASVGPSEVQLGEQSWQTRVEHAVALSAACWARAQASQVLPIPVGR